MYDFIVLGLVPGTQIQITFLTWLLAASVIVGVIVTYKYFRGSWRTPTYRLYRTSIRQQTRA
ncbi:MAG TPA: hypothetical protein VD735_03045 [Candidatus Saccharimonadales bacterium]|nr:hypothetical protein [Candidatus Saccharimonadales bacterium]